jgi:hypothetical protein
LAVQVVQDITGTGYRAGAGNFRSDQPEGRVASIQSAPVGYGATNVRIALIVQLRRLSLRFTEFAQDESLRRPVRNGHRIVLIEDS